MSTLQSGVQDKVGRFTFDPASHSYYLDGKPLVGTTTVIGVIAKNALISWAANLTAREIKEWAESVEGEILLKDLLEKCTEAARAHTRRKEAAADIGTQVHGAIEGFIKGQINAEEYEHSLDNPLAINMYTNFVGWAQDNEVTFHESEKKLYSVTNWCAGTCDFTCSIGDKTFVGDIKTSARIYPENFIQTAAYRMMLEEMGIGERYDGSLIVNIKKDGKFDQDKDVKYRFDYQTDLKAFLGALEIYKYLKTFN